jgi:hypothetical protein
MSGSIPLACIDIPLGVKYRAVVSLIAPLPARGIIDCTEPLPKLLVPIIIALE